MTHNHNFPPIEIGDIVSIVMDGEKYTNGKVMSRTPPPPELDYWVDFYKPFPQLLVSFEGIGLVVVYGDEIGAIVSWEKRGIK